MNRCLNCPTIDATFECNMGQSCLHYDANNLSIAIEHRLRMTAKTFQQRAERYIKRADEEAERRAKI